MANHVRRQIREAVATALTGLTTTGARVFQSRVYPLQDADLPGLRIYAKDEEIEIGSLGVSRLLERTVQLVVEGCAKATTDLDDTLDQILKEVETAMLGAGLGGGKYADLRRVEVEMEGEGEKPVGIMRITFEVLYCTTVGAPDTAW